MRPSRYAEGKPIGDSSPFPSEEYSFSRRINRINKEEQIEPLFDSIIKIQQSKRFGLRKFYGEISGMRVRIDFSKNHPCFICARSEEDLDNSYNRILDILIGVN